MCLYNVKTPYIQRNYAWTINWFTEYKQCLKRKFKAYRHNININKIRRKVYEKFSKGKQYIGGYNQMKNYDEKRVSRGYRQIWDGKENKKAWDEWEFSMRSTDMYNEFMKDNRNYNKDWKEFVEEFYYI